MKAWIYRLSSWIRGLWRSKKDIELEAKYRAYFSDKLLKHQELYDPKYKASIPTK